jgi:hypothetical protein
MMTTDYESCVEAFPLGKPAGCDRYGLTPAMARVYRELVVHHDATGVLPTMDEIGQRLGGINKSAVHDFFRLLVERGWLKADGNWGIYSLVEPIRRFAHIP